MTPHLRTLRPDELEGALTFLTLTFGQAPSDDDVEVELAVVDPDRVMGAYVEDQLVGVAGSFALTTSLPGGAQAPFAGVTWVGVDPAHRRQGVLTAFMARQLADLRAEGTAIAALWASQGAIYQRYGYGASTWVMSVSLPSRAAFRRPVAPGGVRRVAPTGELLAPAYDAVAARTPGMPGRDAHWWRTRLHDPEPGRDRATPLQCAVTEGGYALYAQTASWSDGVPDGTVVVREIVAADEPARERLWRYLLDLDLMGTVTCRHLAADDPLLHLLAEPRLAHAKLSESLYIRLVDVAGALAARRYACAVDVVLDVRDVQCPWNAGRWRLTGDLDGARCTRTDEPADLVLDVGDLGAAYLGGTALATRRATVEQRTPGTLARASTAFGPVDRSPWCPMVF